MYKKGNKPNELRLPCVHTEDDIIEIDTCFLEAKFDRCISFMIGNEEVLMSPVQVIEIQRHLEKLTKKINGQREYR